MSSALLARLNTSHGLAQVIGAISSPSALQKAASELGPVHRLVAWVLGIILKV